MIEKTRTVDNLAALFGTGLKTMLDGSFSTSAIAQWAYRFYMENTAYLPQALEYDIMRIVAMQGVPGLEMSHAELTLIADRYMDGE